jgi:choline dehydrogenase-like flavoprotein
VVVGGGVAGLSAALVLGRARRRTLVLDRGGQSNRAAAHVGGLLGHDGTPPAELYELARAQVAAYDAVALRDAEAVDARAEGDGFAVVLGDGGGEVRARALVLATGMAYEVPDVPGFAELWGGAVFHCPFCHGWDVRDRPLVVYGAGEVAGRSGRRGRAGAHERAGGLRRRRPRGRAAAGRDRPRQRAPRRGRRDTRAALRPRLDGRGGWGRSFGRWRSAAGH